ncbi:crotonase/enoyl-CoA hydratase family protein [Pseudomonas gingeri]|uniref:crotonase/enoyl-CoA hydratase family protein n=1 Tax=Pseudomonas gingeri TaxID=117681 RepID=UPI0015A1CDF0|nr:crotonase/enoyl-CoA hydratase family protein [Pseudomonas gingeri]NWA02719.1 crotonase/enoyl-CoA hydratase family protein [Pseudomonas gingeri]NWA12107.1 crotonase/enoyl-CoA hydratase family protein [Pseudomonas gingeri]NWA57486.1 crotonase/enoyl-CoA hydratase family protein [Pseudomonas gingeri]NWA93829.1 crotonase/enoyl-CoA hydratase family protein [Pseudomonas gingeri]NWB03301.1 crotonase/enoyl-CoA hydratase family protein [Pseudomonas gingeri]
MQRLFRKIIIFSALSLFTGAVIAQSADKIESRPNEVTMVDIPTSSSHKITVERRGEIVLIGINRPYIQNRLDPEAYLALAKAYYDYDHDPSLRAAVLFGHGDNFSQGLDVEGFKAVASTGGPTLGDGLIDPLGKKMPGLTKPLIVAVHGDTWNMAHELFLVADIRVAANNTNFGQDENTHGRFPGGGSTVRFVREAGWANAMRYILTGDHWTAREAYRMGTVQEIPDPQSALDKAIELANKIAANGPLGIKASLASAHRVIDPVQADALSQLDAQRATLYKSKDFQEGRKAEAEGRSPVYHGN